jgi:hypothetical protein
MAYKIWAFTPFTVVSHDPKKEFAITFIAIIHDFLKQDDTHFIYIFKYCSSIPTHTVSMKYKCKKKSN